MIASWYGSRFNRKLWKGPSRRNRSTQSPLWFIKNTAPVQSNVESHHVHVHACTHTHTHTHTHTPEIVREREHLTTYNTCCVQKLEIPSQTGIVTHTHRFMDTCTVPSIVAQKQAMGSCMFIAIKAADFLSQVKFSSTLPPPLVLSADMGCSISQWVRGACSLCWWRGTGWSWPWLSTFHTTSKPLWRVHEWGRRKGGGESLWIGV